MLVSRDCPFDSRPSLAVMPGDEYERLIAEDDFMDCIEVVKEDLEAEETGRSRPTAEVVREWDAL